MKNIYFLAVSFLMIGCAVNTTDEQSDNYKFTSDTDMSEYDADEYYGPIGCVPEVLEIELPNGEVYLVTVPAQCNSPYEKDDEDPYIEHEQNQKVNPNEEVNSDPVGEF
jgi:hypothetical protein